MLSHLVKTLLLGVIAIAGSLGFVALLYRSIHFIEEHPTKAKEKIKLMTISVMVGHTVLLFRGFSLVSILFSLLCQFLFFNLLEDYPHIETNGAGFISAVFLTFVNHMWYLATMIRERMGVLEILFHFFVLVWSVPFAFFLSLTANDECINLPGNKKPIRRTFAGKVLDTLFYRKEKSHWEDR